MRSSHPCVSATTLRQLASVRGTVAAFFVGALLSAGFVTTLMRTAAMGGPGFTRGSLGTSSAVMDAKTASEWQLELARRAATRATRASAQDGESDQLSLRLAAANALRKQAERQQWLSPEHSESVQFNALTPADSPMWYLFSPYYPCPGTFEKEPGSATLHDGGKWICGMQELQTARQNAGEKAGCVVYSFGSNNDFTFEERIHRLAPVCELHTFDPTSSPPPASIGEYVTFHGDFGVGGADSTGGPFPVKSIPRVMKELGHDKLDVLKMDVEGYEWDILRLTDWSRVRIGQILVEFHPQLGPGPRNAGEMNALFVNLEKAGYMLASIEPVTYFNYGQVELVFIHESWRPAGWVTPSDGSSS